jgi:hypothetical protein
LGGWLDFFVLTVAPPAAKSEQFLRFFLLRKNLPAGKQPFPKAVAVKATTLTAIAPGTARGLIAP